jgi:AcrR family transcriptional regulator
LTAEGKRVRMTGQERRAQLLEVGLSVFAEVGFEATTIEEVAKRANITKPVVYEHFGGKEGLYAVIVDREVQRLLQRISAALDPAHPRERLRQAALAFLGYIEDEPEGFRVLVRDSPIASTRGTLASLIGDIASQVEYIFEDEFKSRGFDKKLAPIYSQACVGMVALVGQWWMETRKPKKEVVAAHLVNLAWSGLSRLDPDPSETPTL